MVENMKTTVTNNRILGNVYAIASAVLTAVSVGGYFVTGFIDRQYLLSPDSNKINLLIVAVIAFMASIAAVIAIVKASHWQKLLFIFFLLLCLGVALISLLVAGLIGAMG